MKHLAYTGVLPNERAYHTPNRFGPGDSSNPKSKKSLVSGNSPAMGKLYTPTIPRPTASSSHNKFVNFIQKNIKEVAQAKEKSTKGPQLTERGKAAISPPKATSLRRKGAVNSNGSVGSLGSPMNHYNNAVVKKNLKKMKSKENFGSVESKSSNLFG